MLQISQPVALSSPRPMFALIRPIVFLLTIAAFGFTYPRHSHANDTPTSIDALSPATTGGAPVVDRALARLSTHRRLMMIAAHPDDEDTFVLAHVGSLGGEASYLSLTRGDGGQNLIGSELGTGLGLLRSRELESARQIDGARQYFTRAFDFGYTRSLDETLQRWPEKILMEDARAVARRFKPQVLVAVFPTDARAGHGQHQASAVIAERLFAELSGEGDKDRPWSVDSFYRASWWNPTAATLEVDLGSINPFTGRSTFQTALASRSRHRCQDMGFEQPPGRATASLIWQGGTSGEATDDLFGDSDTRLAAIAKPLLEIAESRIFGKELEGTLAQVEILAREAREALVPSQLHMSAPALAKMVRLLNTLSEQTMPRQASAVFSKAPSPEDLERLAIVHELIGEKLYIAREGLSAAAGIVIDAIAEQETLIPGESLDVRSLFWNTGEPAVDNLSVELIADDGWQLTGSRTAEPRGGRFRVEVTHERLHTIQIPGDARLTTPYFLRHPRNGDLYNWQGADPAERARPSSAAALSLRFTGQVLGAEMEWIREVVHRYRDQAIGEVRRPLQVVPGLEVSLDRGLVVRPSHRRGALVLRVDLLRNQEPTIKGELKVHVPDHWPAPPKVPFEMSGPRGQRLALEVTVPVPAPLDTGRYELAVSVDGEQGQSLERIEYDHIRPTALPAQAHLSLLAAPIALPDVNRVAYLRGASDRMPELLLEIGLPLELVTAEALLLDDLDRFDTIVIGSRAFEIEPLLAKANERLLDFARRGGTLLVQYQQYQFAQGEFAPYALEIKRPHDRVTDENAAVRLLDPNHPFFHVPNSIDERDWQGWVQERGLYFAGTWDAKWTPLLAMSDPIGDPGGDEKHGSLLVAELGEGRYIYTGLAFFRQLPAGVVGAYRLFLNLLTPAS